MIEEPKMISCACGCGELIRSFARGPHEPRRFKFGHAVRLNPRFKNHSGFPLEKNGYWKGGKYKNVNGYIKVKKPSHPFCDCDGYVVEHRLVMEQHLGRYLDPKEIVHHINHKRDDNRIENLELFESNSKHMEFEMEFKYGLQVVKKKKMELRKYCKQLWDNHKASLLVLGIGVAISVAIAGGDVTAGTHRGR